MRNLIKPISIVVGVALLLFIFGFRIEHPRGGLKNAVGSASSSLVIVKKISNVNAGDKIVIGVDSKTSPILGIVSGINGNTVSVQLDNGFQKGDIKNVAGKLLIVIPFIGAIFSAVGL